MYLELILQAAECVYVFTLNKELLGSRTPFLMDWFFEILASLFTGQLPFWLVPPAQSIP